VKNYREVIKEALDKIKKEYIQNNQNIKHPEINWVGLQGKIELLSDIANSLLEKDDECLKDIVNVAKIISNKEIQITK
jgi:hypothetical protein